MKREKSDSLYYFSDKKGNHGFYQFDGEIDEKGTVNFRLVDKDGNKGPDLTYPIEIDRPKFTIGGEVAISCNDQHVHDFLLGNGMIKGGPSAFFDHKGQDFVIFSLSNVGKYHASFLEKTSEKLMHDECEVENELEME